MSAMEVDIDHLRTWLGRERHTEDVLHAFPAQALAAALDRPDFPGDGADLPAGWQWLYFLETPRASATGEDGHPRLGDFLPPVPLPRRMWAAGEFELSTPLRIGRPADKRSRIVSIDAKHGRSGGLVFVGVEHVYSQDGQACIRELQRLVYREATAATAQAPAPACEPEPAAHARREFPIDPVLLFRYSALTYNSHRIHYDREYASARESYPALVVHGPLLATLLLEHLGAVVPDGRVRRFEFRAIKPSFDNAAIVLGGFYTGGRVDLWTAQHDSPCMKATAELA